MPCHSEVRGIYLILFIPVSLLPGFFLSSAALAKEDFVTSICNSIYLHWRRRRTLWGDGRGVRDRKMVYIWNRERNTCGGEATSLTGFCVKAREKLKTKNLSIMLFKAKFIAVIISVSLFCVSSCAQIKNHDKMRSTAVQLVNYLKNCDTIKILGLHDSLFAHLEKKIIKIV